MLPLEWQYWQFWWLGQDQAPAAGDPSSADIGVGQDILSDPSLSLISPTLAFSNMSNDGTPPALAAPASTLLPTSGSGLPASSTQPRLSISRNLLPTNPPPTTSTAAPPAGPTSGRSYVVPPRPKPGRKPATDEPASKRKAQNRESQRAFRARKAAKINEMQEAADETNKKHKQDIAELVAKYSKEIAGLKEQITQLSLDRDHWKRQCYETSAQRDSFQLGQSYPYGQYADQQPSFFAQPTSPREITPASMDSYPGDSPKAMPDAGCGGCDPKGHCACFAAVCEIPDSGPDPAPATQSPGHDLSTSMEGVKFQNADPFAEHEFDFTHAFTKRTKDSCGFCTDDANCLCARPTSSQQNSNSSDSVALRKRAGPGSCADCQADPKKRAWCMDVSRVTQLKNEETASRPISRGSSIGSPLGTMEPHIPDASTPYGTKQSLGCSEAYKLFQGRLPTDKNQLDWVSNLKRAPRRGSQLKTLPDPRDFSAVELDTAAIITTLGSSMKPIQPRQEDGENSEIVRRAQALQRSTQSPFWNSPRLGPSA